MLPTSARRALSSARKRSTTIHRANSKFIGTNRFGYYNYQPPRVANFELFRGDLVQVKSNAQGSGGRSLPDQGKQARIKSVDRQQSRLLLPELNVQEELVHQASAYKQPKTVIRAQPYEYEDVELVNPITGLPCRLGFEWRKLTVDGFTRAVRVDSELGTVIPVPPPASSAMKERRPALTATRVCDARKITYEKHPLYDKLKAKREEFFAAQGNDEAEAEKAWAKARNAHLVDSRLRAIAALDAKRDKFVQTANETLKKVFTEKQARESSNSSA